MLKKSHNASTIIQLVVILLITITLWAPKFAFPEQTLFFSKIENDAFNLLFGRVNHYTAISLTLSLIFILMSAAVAKSMLNYERLRLSGKNFPVLIFIVFASGLNIGFFSPQILLLFTTVWVMHLVFLSPEVLENDNLIFFAAALLGVVSFFYPPVFMLFLWLVTMAFRFENSRFRKILLIFLGFLFPWIWFVGICFLVDSFELIALYWNASVFIPKLPDLSNWLEVVYAAALILIIAVFIFDRISRRKESLIIIRRRSDISISMTFFILAGAFFSYNFYEHLTLMAIPATAMISYSYHEGLKSKHFDYLLTFFVFVTVLCAILNIWL